MRPIYPFPLHLALAGSLAAWAVRAAGSVPALCALLATAGAVWLAPECLALAVGLAAGCLTACTVRN